MQEVTILQRFPALIAALSGEIDSANADEFYEEIRALYDRAPADVTFECEKLAFIDSTALGTFVKLLKHVKEGGHVLRFRGMQPRIKKLFVICSLDTIMEIEP